MSDVTNFSSECVTYLLISHLCSSASSSITQCACSIKQFVVISELIGKYLEYLLWLFYSPMGKFVIGRKLFPDYSFVNERKFHNTLLHNFHEIRNVSLYFLQNWNDTRRNDNFWWFSKVTKQTTFEFFPFRTIFRISCFPETGSCHEFVWWSGLQWRRWCSFV